MASESSVVPIRETIAEEQELMEARPDIAPQVSRPQEKQLGFAGVAKTIASNRDWRIETSSPEKSVVFLSGAHAGGQLSPVSGLSDRGAEFITAFLALSAAISKWRHDYMATAAGKPEPGSFAINVQGVRCRVQRVTEARFHVRVAPELMPLGELLMPQALKTFLLSKELDSGGLVIVCGNYGSGKTNTVNAVVRERVARCGGYALMLGKPIEYEFSGFHGNTLSPGYVEQVDLMGLDLNEEIQASMRNFPSGATSILGYPELTSHHGVGEMLRAANRGNLVFCDMHAKDLEAAILNILSLAGQDGEKYARELLGNALRLVIHQTMTLMPERPRGVHVSYKHIKVSNTLRGAISDTGMALSKVINQVLLPQTAAAGQPH